MTQRHLAGRRRVRGAPIILSRIEWPQVLASELHVRDQTIKQAAVSRDPNVPPVRKSQGSIKLSKDEFRRRWNERF
jgi:hypothetical protein